MKKYLPYIIFAVVALFLLKKFAPWISYNLGGGILSAPTIPPTKHDSAKGVNSIV